MIPEHMEPKGLSPETPDFDDTDARAIVRHDAAVGSDTLLAAIMKARGVAIAAQPSQPRPRQRTRPITRRKARAPTCCPLCHSPLKEPAILIATIQAAAAAYFGIPVNSMTSHRRSFEISHPRQIAMYLASEITPKSTPEIGRRFGNRDHTTVLYAIKSVRRRMASDPEVAVDVAALRENLLGDDPWGMVE